ncbi:hypothetical protein Q8F55_002609 [Vanrija albida]|uniref:TauD/TfdA-like domain-containing protein n=1 Tax=Vanrija albida TaxID=181172 RepID=A0ABR3QAA4_9TREE
MSPAAAAPLTATIEFTLPATRLDHDPAVYLTYDPAVQRPSEALRVPVANLRDELEAGASLATVAQQLSARGFAVATHASSHLGGIPSVEGTQAYLDETAALLKDILGCSRVIAWNSVCRKNAPGVAAKDVPRQQAPEKGFVPSERQQPVASIAHVDQDEVWGAELVAKAAGSPAHTFARAQIVNLWRPLSGPVTNAPLAMLSYHDIQSDISKHGSQFGVGMDIHHRTGQGWAYIRHQMPDEVVFLKCFDTAQGADGSALYCGHVAVKVDNDADGIAPELVVPRESIEVRLVALWDKEEA